LRFMSARPATTKPRTSPSASLVVSATFLRKASSSVSLLRLNRAADCPPWRVREAMCADRCASLDTPPTGPEPVDEACAMPKVASLPSMTTTPYVSSRRAFKASCTIDVSKPSPHATSLPLRGRGGCMTSETSSEQNITTPLGNSFSLRLFHSAAARVRAASPPATPVLGAQPCCAGRAILQPIQALCHVRSRDANGDACGIAASFCGLQPVQQTFKLV